MPIEIGCRGASLLLPFVDLTQDPLRVEYFFPPDNYKHGDIVKLVDVNGQELSANRLLVITPRPGYHFREGTVKEFLRNTVVYIRGQEIGFQGKLCYVNEQEENYINLEPLRILGIHPTVQHIFEANKRTALVIQAIFQVNPNGARFWEWPNDP